jgi:hypothetical protein
LASRLSASPALGVLLGGAGVEAVAGVDLLGGTGGAFGSDAPGLGAGVEAVVGVDVVGVDVVGDATALTGVDADEVVLLDEPPQPASARRPTARVSVDNLDAECGVA